MDRRHFGSALAAGAVLFPPSVRAQAARPRRIGYLTTTTSAADAGIRPLLMRALRELGYLEGVTLQIEARTAGDHQDRLNALAEELVASRVELIVAITPRAILAAARATRNIPIVMAFWGGDGLLESGIVASFARPGGNVTGVYMLADELEVKRLDLLLQAVPRAKVVGVLNPGMTGAKDGKPFAYILEQAAQARGVKLRLSGIPGPSGYGRVFEALRADRVDAVLVPTTPRFLSERVQIVESATKARLPAIYDWGEYARDGGLLAYGASSTELQRRVAIYIDRILKGTLPGELPIEQPAKFEFVVNLRTAKVMNFVVPQSLLLRADEVIE